MTKEEILEANSEAPKVVKRKKTQKLEMDVLRK